LFSARLYKIILLASHAPFLNIINIDRYSWCFIFHQFPHCFALVEEYRFRILQLVDIAFHRIDILEHIQFRFQLAGK
jgi:hypothetical protein